MGSNLDKSVPGAEDSLISGHSKPSASMEIPLANSKQQNKNICTNPPAGADPYSDDQGLVSSSLSSDTTSDNEENREMKTDVPTLASQSSVKKTTNCRKEPAGSLGADCDGDINRVASFDMALERDLEISRFNAQRNAGRIVHFRAPTVEKVEESDVPDALSPRSESSDNGSPDSEASTIENTSPPTPSPAMDAESARRAKHRVARMEAAAHRRSLIADLCKGGKGRSRHAARTVYVAETMYFSQDLRSPKAHTHADETDSPVGGLDRRRVRWLTELEQEPSLQPYTRCPRKSCVRHASQRGSLPAIPSSSADAVRRRYLSRLNITPPRAMAGGWEALCAWREDPASVVAVAPVEAPPKAVEVQQVQMTDASLFMGGWMC
eukprot:1159146-Rhodomonas_salina.1